MNQFISISYSKNIKSYLVVLLLFISYSFQAQVEPQDTVKGYNLGTLDIKDPKSIVEAYTYDPVTNKYIYTKTFEGFNINYPIVLTPKQYDELDYANQCENILKKNLTR